MRSGRFFATLCAASLALVLTSSAGAANPQQIYKDLADNGRLDQRYSTSDLRAALASAALGGYSTPAQEDMATEILSAIGSQERGQAEGGVAAVGSGGTLPFTGLDLVLIVGMGLTLVLVGTALRRLRPKRAPDARHS